MPSYIIRAVKAIPGKSTDDCLFEAALNGGETFSTPCFADDFAQAWTAFEKSFTGKYLPFAIVTSNEIVSMLSAIERESSESSESSGSIGASGEAQGCFLVGAKVASDPPDEKMLIDDFVNDRFVYAFFANPDLSKALEAATKNDAFVTYFSGFSSISLKAELRSLEELSLSHFQSELLKLKK